MEKEIFDLQIKLSYLEDFVNNLNNVVIDQSKDNENLKLEIKRLHHKISQLEERVERKGEFKADEQPPHY